MNKSINLQILLKYKCIEDIKKKKKKIKLENAKLKKKIFSFM